MNDMTQKMVLGEGAGGERVNDHEPRELGFNSTRSRWYNKV